jgi:predicted deacylase
MARLNEYPVELTPPDISPYKTGNTGIDYATTFDSGQDGPHVMVNAVTHGNELCGAIVLDFLFRENVRPTRGKLTLSFANYRAFLNFDARYPLLSRFVDEDFNRLWSPDVLDSPRQSDELDRARELRPLVDTVDYLLDLHSMQTRIPALLLAGPLPKGRTFAAGVGYPQYVVSDEGHAAGKRMRDYGAFGDAASHRNALLAECGQHWEKSSVTVAMDTTLQFLRHLDAIDADFAAAHMSGQPPKQQFIEVTQTVTIKNENFRFVSDYIGMEVIERAGTVIAHDGDTEVRTSYDNCVLIMPSRRTIPGHTAVRLGRFIEN